ncbi:MAG: transposase [Nitrososphaerota archaeon]|nr:transposase [Nitrososphaerota archaeon]MDG6937478.1 transposase [Nitrososphaerota archaeon]
MIRYLRDMQDAMRYALQVAYRDAIDDEKHKIPSLIQLRREVREWFYSRYDYARHHVNPVCRTAVALLRSYRRNHNGELRIPEVRRLAMRIDGELFRVVGDKVRITLQPDHYTWLHINTSNKHYQEYSNGRPSELLVTDMKVCLTFVVGDGKKPLGSRLMAQDLNFRSIDSTGAVLSSKPSLTGVERQPLREIVRVQNDYSRRRRALQKHVKDPQKRARKLKETRGRQRNRVRDALHKLSTKTVRENPDATFVFEDLKGIRKGGEKKGRRLRTCLNRRPYRMYQSMAEYKSPNGTLYVNPRGISSECPVCGGKLEHPAWATSRCGTCGADYDRDRLASLAILLRGLRLCGPTPFAASADASWRQMREEYLYPHGMPEAMGAGGTDAAGAPNGDVYECTRS